jgi:hypothetical protein
MKTGREDEAVSHNCELQDSKHDKAASAPETANAVAGVSLNHEFLFFVISVNDNNSILHVQ